MKVGLRAMYERSLHRRWADNDGTHLELPNHVGFVISRSSTENGLEAVPNGLVMALMSGVMRPQSRR